MAAVRDINAAFEAWLEITDPADDAAREDDSGLRFRRLGPVTAALETESDYLVLCRIETDPAHRGEGAASRLIEALKALCDRFHVTLLGQATAYGDDEGLDQRALLAWYERHGFEIDRARTAQPLVWYPERPRY